MRSCGTPTVTAARDALRAAQQQITVDSNVHGLVSGDVHLWRNHDFETSIRFELHEELARGARRAKLPEFFAQRLAAAEATLEEG